MSIINGPKGISEKEMQTSANHFANFNELNQEEKDELLYICAQFAKYYNALSQKKTDYTPKMIIESFDEAIKIQMNFKTRVNLFYKQVSTINDILLNSIKEDKNVIIGNKEEIKNTLKQEIKKDLDKSIAEIKKRQEIENKKTSLHYPSNSRDSYSYSSPCGGGRSYGPSC